MSEKLVCERVEVDIECLNLQSGSKIECLKLRSGLVDATRVSRDVIASTVLECPLGKYGTSWSIQ